MAKRWILRLLKLFGVGLFIVILSTINREELFAQLEAINVILFGSSVPVLFLIYFCKTERFRSLVHAGKVALSRMEAWKIFNIGVFLAGITPAKLGELGRAAYLQSAGMQAAVAIGISLLDRALDVVFIGAVGIVSLGVLFGWEWSVVGVFVALLSTPLWWLLWKMAARIRPVVIEALLPITMWTVMSWSLYFLWAILIALSVHITVSIPVLIAAFTITGVVSLLPIAPSGLGTRDATLLLLLAPYGVKAEQAVSLAFLMFISIIFSGVLGGWYFMKGVR